MGAQRSRGSAIGGGAVVCCCDLESQTAKDLLDLTRGDVDTQISPHLRAAQRDCPTLRSASHCINAIALDLAAGTREDELGDAVACQGRNAPISAALKPMGRVGMHAVTLGHAADRCRIEPGGLDQHVLRVFGDHAVEAAHNAGERDRLLCIGNNKIVGRELTVDSVERFQCFACAGTANDDGAAFQQVEIEGDPSSSSRFTTSSGDGPIFTLRTMRAVYRAQPSASSITIGKNAPIALVIPTGGAPLLHAGAERSAVPWSFGSTGFNATL